MWIRSQDREKLVETRSVQINDSRYNLVGRVYIDAVIDRYYVMTIATYSTKEKALKVLDMIEEHITMVKEINRESVTDRYGVYHENVFTNSDIVFQMPSDDDVD